MRPSLRSRLSFFLMVCLAHAAAPGSATAQLRPSQLIGDGMVLQRGAEVPLWGWAEAGEQVTVAFGGATYADTAAASGRWRVTLPPMEAGGPYDLTLRGRDTTLRVQNVMVGDVWIASGQSNMEWVVADAQNADEEIAAADAPDIRHFKVPRSWAEAPSDTLAGGAWTPATPEHVGDFTAVGYFFARALRSHAGVPIGLINATWGGSRIEPWMSAEALGLSAAEAEAVIEEERAHEQRLRDTLRARIGELPEEDAGLVDGEARWADPKLSDSTWQTIPAPSLWEEAGYEGMDGVAWYRTTLTLTEAEAARDLRLSLGPIDDEDITYVNGQEVGRTQGWAEPRRYAVPAAALRAGENVVAVRVMDTGGGGGLHGAPDSLYAEPLQAELLQAEPGGAAARTALAGPWRFKVGAATVNAESQKNQVPTLLYNKMIHPLLPFPITGVLWYQGESNAQPGDAYAYRDQFKRMIQQWRADWNSGTFPFLYVQLANFMEEDDAPSESDWAMLRESQSAALALPKTAQAVAIDLGEADDIHPRNKQDVGRRLALAARALAYGEDLVYSGPVYQSHRVEDGRMVLGFGHTGGGLVAKGDSLQGFALAGPDRAFVWAEATIEDGRVVVQSDAVETPAAVRYAWGDNPADANLYNEEGLPAAPFRTDDW